MRQTKGDGEEVRERKTRERERESLTSKCGSILSVGVTSKIETKAFYCCMTKPTISS